MSPDDYDGDLEDYVKSVLVSFGSTLGMDARDGRLKALGRQLLEALEQRRNRQKLASIVFPKAEIDAFADNARRIQALIVQMRRSPIWPWLHARCGIVEERDNYLERTLRFVTSDDGQKMPFKDCFLSFPRDSALLNNIDPSGNNLFILNELPRMYEKFGNESALLEKLCEYRLPDIKGQYNPTSRYISFLLNALNVLQITNDGKEWTAESLVQRMKRARDGRKKNS